MENSNVEIYDVIVLGGGAAGLFSAIEASKNGHKTLLLESNKTLGKKIRISGGGRCNFTNSFVDSTHFISKNSHFVKSALSQYGNLDFIELVKDYEIDYYEKKKGQLFCKNSSLDIISMLKAECDKNQVEINYSQFVLSVCKLENNFQVMTKAQKFVGKNIIVATGGLSMKAIGASDIGYRIAKSFGHEVIETCQALVPLLLDKSDLAIFKDLSGVSLPVKVTTLNQSFLDDLLFTHKGLSGPAILQISSYWRLKESLFIDLLPGINVYEELIKAKRLHPKKRLDTILSKLLPGRLSTVLFIKSKVDGKRTFAELSDQNLKNLSSLIQKYEFIPYAYDIMNKAEVTRGGVSTKNISSKTMESKLEKGLYFIGEVLDITGQLGGYNFQWAWSSAFVAGNSIRFLSEGK